MGIVGNEIADHLARVGCLHSLIGPVPALGVSAKVARGGNGEHWQSVHRQRQAKGFLKKKNCENSWRIAPSEPDTG
jgi:hypothetical protein